MRTVVPGIEIAAATDAILGESPIWSAARRRLLWVDTAAQKLYATDPASGRNETQELPDVVGMIAQAEAGTLTLALGCDLARLTTGSKVEQFAHAPHSDAAYRLNDGKYDHRDRLWIGLMDYDLRPGTGLLYRYDLDGSWHVCDDGFTLSNGLDWSPDGRTFYFTDSRKGDIYAYDFEPERGEISHRRLLAHIDPDEGKPDGLTVDPEGFLLSVLFDGGAILRIAPDGKFERKIALPVPRPTSCAFAGDNQYLFVTTARLGLTNADLQAAPASGALLKLDYKGIMR